MEAEVFRILTDNLSRCQKTNPTYSLRAYARKLGIHASALSEIMNGKRSITKKMAKQILDRLGYAPTEIESLLRNKKNVSTSGQPLDLEYFKVISDWYYFAILSLAELPNFKANPAWVGQRLNISESTAKNAIDRLLELELLKKNENGKVEVTGLQFKTPTDIANISLRNHTSQTLDLAKESLFRDSVEIRDFSTVTLTFDPKQMMEVKRYIKDFRRKFQEKFEKGKRTEVYKLAIQFFPLSFRGE